MSDPLKIGIGGPVGAGKTQLVERLTRHMSRDISMAAITNDIYTIEDAKILAANGILPIDRIIGVETGGCPHTAIREDTSMNTAAIEELKRRHPDLQVIFVESGRGQPLRDIQPRTGRPLHLHHRRGPRREDPAQSQPRRPRPPRPGLLQWRPGPPPPARGFRRPGGRSLQGTGARCRRRGCRPAPGSRRTPPGGLPDHQPLGREFGEGFADSVARDDQLLGDGGFGQPRARQE